MYLDNSYLICELPEPLSDDIISWAYDFIDHDIIYAEDTFYGITHNVHITLLSDIIDSDLKKIKQSVENIPTFSCVLGEMKKFTTNSKFDVLYIDVLSDDAIKINKELSQYLSHSKFYVNYIPHVTICYLKKGCGENFLGSKYFNGSGFQVETITFSSPTQSAKFNLGIKK